MKNKINLLTKSFVVITLFALLVAGCSISGTYVKVDEKQKPAELVTFNPDTVHASKYDIGKMWTFDYPPTDYFTKTYGFTPDDDWFENVRLSALKFGSWCSASFVSSDGLIMTNHHCVDFITNRIEKEDEDIAANGFYAESLDKERKVPGLFVDQLVLIQDVTDEIVSAIEQGKNDAEKLKLKEDKIIELQKEYSDETGLICKVTELYNGGKYSLYGYRRYNDVRMVLVNERAVGLYGGDPDNFTYPRYDADFAFLRVYDEDGKPLHTDNFFKWSKSGAKPGEPLFVVGNPGRTERLKTVSQMLYERDYKYRPASIGLNGVVKILEDEMEKHPEKKKELEGSTFYLANSAKVVKGIYEGLLDPYIVARKKAFERDFKNAVTGNPELAKKYGNLWQEIDNIQNEYKTFAGKLIAYKIDPTISSFYFMLALKVKKFAEQMQLPEEKREPKYKADEIDTTIAQMYPENFDKSVEDRKLALQIELIETYLSPDNFVVKNIFKNLPPKEAAKMLLENSLITNKEKLEALLKKSPDEILNTDDPFITFVTKTQDEYNRLKERQEKLSEKEKVLENELGRALYEVYGTEIPPDATFTLRISDGVMKSYPYNGTIAPLFTTFYGLYDRYYSHQKKYPWALPKRWANPPANMDLSVPYNFISTNDIVGGNSGSPIINKNMEVVGAVFDGNIESLPGTFIYLPKANRTVSVASQGIIELLNTILNAKRISAELEAGEIPDKYK